MKIKTYTVNIGNYDKLRTDIDNENNYTFFRNNARNARAIRFEISRLGQSSTRVERK